MASMNSARSSFLLPEKVGSGHETAVVILVAILTRNRTNSSYVKITASSASEKERRRLQ
jgi:hypothetical protein